MIGIIDYGAGNLRSVKKALDYLGATNRVIPAGEDFGDEYTKLVLPGVGAFGAAVDRMKDAGAFNKLRRWLLADKPFLGICLGLQLLFEGSTESGDSEGLGVFPGNCRRFNERKVPQIGWNQLEDITDEGRCALLKGIEPGDYFYFLHSYYAPEYDRSIIVACTEYGIKYPSVITKGNIYAVQFHPEKSGELGLKLLRNWVELC